MLLTWLIAAGCARLGDQHAGQKYRSQPEPWRKGYLDIHHIHTGRGNATFCMLPDGTTLLIDAGELDARKFKRYFPLKVADIYPDDSRRPGEWIAHYIETLFPDGETPHIDYALITHFHGDHYGAAASDAPIGKHGYYLTGITEVAERIPIGKLIDRGYPDYNFPVALKTAYRADTSFVNYLRFIACQLEHGMKAERLRVGSTTQLTLLHDPSNAFNNFEIENLKANNELTTGKNTAPSVLFTADDMATSLSENPLSLAVMIRYGAFDYYTGGDNTGIPSGTQQAWFDVETPLAMAAGEADVIALNHHGNRDATNDTFLNVLQPQVAVQQSWCSDHPGMEVFHRLADESRATKKPDLFATHLFEETKVTYGPWFANAYQSSSGHILIRVLPGGAHFQVITLDGRGVNSVFGPYTSR